MIRILCMAVPKRAEIVRYLRAHIPNLQVVWDKKRCAAHTWQSTFKAAGAEPAVIVEDDIVLTKDFMRKLMAVIDMYPDRFIQFHSRTKEDITVGSRYRAGATFMNNQCLYYPAGLAAKILEYSEGHPLWVTNPSGTDAVTAAYLKDNKIRYWNHVPSLVDHLPVQSEIDSRRSKHRRSTTFQDPELSGLTIPVLPPNPPRQRR